MFNYPSSGSQTLCIFFVVNDIPPLHITPTHRHNIAVQICRLILNLKEYEYADWFLYFYSKLKLAYILESESGLLLCIVFHIQGICRGVLVRNNKTKE